MSTIRRARPGDLTRITALLQEASLPAEGIAAHLSTFLVAESENMVVGAIGLESYGETGLLRSAVVAPEHRNEGIGTALYTELLALARGVGTKRILLLTTTAEKYFGLKGFGVIDRATVRGPVTGSEEFKGACPATAVCMELLLEDVAGGGT